MMGGGVSRVTKHEEYYLNDGSVSFLTGKTLFKVHQSFFERESEVFRDLFASAAEEDPQSGTDARPFTLDVKPNDFAKFLWVWYDKDYSYHQQTKENWITILSLANRWEFPKIKELAIRELDALVLSPAERISIYSEHGIDNDRLLDSYVEICKSPTIPTEEEASFMKMEALINVLEAREDAQRRALKLRQESPTSAGLEDGTLREIVSRIFGTSLNLRSNGFPKGSGIQAPRLNGERPRGTSVDETITLGQPQVPHRKTRSNEPSFRANSFHQTSDEVNRNQEGELGSQVASSNAQEQEDVRSQAEKDKKLEDRTRGKEKEEAEKLEKAAKKLEDAEKAKVKEEREKQEKLNQEKERKKQEDAEKVKQAKEKEEREKQEKLNQESERKKQEGQRRSHTRRGA